MTDDVPETEQPPEARLRPHHNHRTIPATCKLHGAIGFTNLVVTKRGGDVVFDPHVAGACVISLDEPGARVLFEALGEWLG